MAGNEDFLAKSDTESREARQNGVERARFETIVSFWNDRVGALNANDEKPAKSSAIDSYDSSCATVSDPPPRHVLLDRDGVLNRVHPCHKIRTWDEFEFLPNSLEALRLLASHGIRTIVISRQPCGGHSYPTPDELEALTRRMLLEIAVSGGRVYDVYYCRHLPENRCNCHDSEKGLFARAEADHGFRLENTYFVSGSEVALQVAAASGCPCIRLERGLFLYPNSESREHGSVASSLYDAAQLILSSLPAYRAARAGTDTNGIKRADCFGPDPAPPEI